MNTTILPSTNSLNGSSCPLALLLILLALACFTLSPQARGTCQDGCLPNNNTVLGDDALLNNTSSNNTAVGFQALQNNTVGDGNTAIGASALVSNTGVDNTAIGLEALFSNTSGADNTATGDNALFNNTSGLDNTATGVGALQGNITGNDNTATGANALAVNGTGYFNTAVGFEALEMNTSGSSNIALGFAAGRLLSTGSNNIDIGNVGMIGESDRIRIGGTQTHTFIAGIRGATVPGVAVFVDAGGRLGTRTSSARFKEAIKPMDKASEAILALKPVTFRYKHDLDPEGIPQFGLVAEDVQKVNPDLVARDEQGKPYSVRYEAVNAMLLNEFLKEHKAFQKEHRTIEELKKQVETLTAGLQKVSAQLELSKPAAKTALNNQ